MNLITESPVWFIPLCFIAGAAYALALYFREKRTDFTRTYKWIMGSARFLVVSIIAFLLLSPLVKTNIRTVEKPVIILAQDNSRSLLFNKDSAYYKGPYRDHIRKLYDDLSEDFDVRAYSFSDKVTEGLKTDYSGKQTNISSLIDELLVRYVNRNVGALILASDGIYNEGNSPLYEANRVAFPIYTIALGDTNVQKDIILSRVNYNKVCYLGNNFPVEAVVTANKCAGANTSLTVSKNGQTLFTKIISINGPSYVETVSLTLEAATSGVQHYRIAVSPVDGEISTANNVQDIFIDVLDARQKILILAGAPHPDVSAIRQSLESNQNYDVEVAFRNEFTKGFAGYNLVILHQIPYKGDALSGSLSGLADSKIPLLYILGSSSDFNKFNNLKTGLNFIQQLGKSDEAQPVFNNEFAYFTISDETRKVLNDIPPLSCPYGDYKMANSATALFYQKIGKIITNRPLILFNVASETKTGVVCGEGLWKWRLNDWLMTGNHHAFDEMVSKTIQFLSVKADKSLFRIKCKNHFLENEQLEFDAEVYNESYELINEPEVRITLTDAVNKKYNYTFAKTAAAYHLNAGLFPVGDYKYTAQVKVGNKVMQESGEFTVAAVNVESLNLIADHSQLNSLALKHKGVMVYPDQMKKLEELIRKRDDIRSISYTQKKYNDVINLLWVFLLIIALLSVEWFLRKRSGAY